MKKQLCFISMILVILWFAVACGMQQSQEPQKPEEKPAVRQEEALLEADPTDATHTYGTIEEFLQGLSESRLATTDESGYTLRYKEVLRDLDAYYRPTAEPEGYELKEIYVSPQEICYLYYDKNLEDTKEARREAHDFEKDFYRITFYLWDLEEPLAGLIRQFNLDENAYIDGKYLYCAEENAYFWEQDGDALELTCPQGMEVSLEELNRLCNLERIAFDSDGEREG